jgi:hypothetical protein
MICNYSTYTPANAPRCECECNHINTDKPTLFEVLEEP